MLPVHRVLLLTGLIAIPLASGCSTSAGGADTLALADGKPAAEGKESGDFAARSLAAEEAGDVAVPTPRPGRAASAEDMPGVEAYAAATARPAALTAFEESGRSQPVKPHSAELDGLIAKYAALYGVPVELVRRVVKRESNFNPAARNRVYWGLMQIRHDTARTMGYRGPASGLLDAETNLKYAVKYLRGAYITAGGNQDRAVRYYASGYYYHAKAKGLLEETGLRN